MDALHDVRGVVHDLLRDAADVDAGAAQRALLADGDLGSVRGRAARRGDAARAGADDEVVEVPASVATGECGGAATASLRCETSTIAQAF